jgi:hypothetical protein
MNTSDQISRQLNFDLAQAISLMHRRIHVEDVWESRVIAPPFVTFSLDGGVWSASCPDCFNHCTQWIGGWVGQRASLDIMEKGKISLNSSSPACSLMLQRLSYPGSQLLT